MSKPALVIMAAGMGSRYGGLKQIDPVDPQGHLIIDFSIYDALQAGFEKVVFIIKHSIEEEFRQRIGERIARQVPVEYVYQELDTLPQGFSVPAGRVKPWGTGHAVLSCKDVIDGPFAVINADDFYGRGAFEAIYRYLAQAQDGGRYDFSMVGYILGNTLTENGHVARGICSLDQNDMLLGIQERTHIEPMEGVAAYTEDGGETWTALALESTVSMNLWGFTHGILPELESRFGAFLTENLPANPLKCEYFLPSVVNQLLAEDKATVKVLHSPDRWYGVTYHEDKETVMQAIAKMKEQGVYPQQLWER